MPLGINDIKKLFFKDVAAKTLRNPADPADNFAVADLNDIISNANNIAGHSDEGLLDIAQNILASHRAAVMSAEIAVEMAAHPLADAELFDNLIEFAKTYPASAGVDAVVNAILMNANQPELKQINYKNLIHIIGNATLDAAKLNVISAIADDKPRAEQAEIDTAILNHAVLRNLMSVAALEKVAKRTEKADDLNLLFEIANDKPRAEQEVIETAILSRDAALISQMPKNILEHIANRTGKSNELDKLVEVATSKPLAEQEAIDTAILTDRGAPLNHDIINGMSLASLLNIVNRTKVPANIERIIGAAAHKPAPEKAAIYTSVLEKHDDLFLASLSTPALGEIAMNTEILLEIEKIMSLFKERPQADQIGISNVIYHRYITKPDLIKTISNKNLRKLLELADNTIKLDIIISISKDRSIQEQKDIDTIIYSVNEAAFNALNKASLETLAARVANSAALDKIVVALKNNGDRALQESICKIIFNVKNKALEQGIKGIIKGMDKKNIIELISYLNKEQLVYIVDNNRANSDEYDAEVDTAVINNPNTGSEQLAKLAKRSQSEDDLNNIALHANTKGNKEVYKSIIGNKFTSNATLQYLLANANGHVDHIDNDSLLEVILHNHAAVDDSMLDPLMLLDRVKIDPRFNKDNIHLAKLHRQQLDLASTEKPDPKTQPVLFNAYHQAQRTIMGVEVFGERAVITSSEQVKQICAAGKMGVVAAAINENDRSSIDNLKQDDTARKAFDRVLIAKYNI